MSWITTKITAGSDTTAILLRTIFYTLLKHPQNMRRLIKELKSAREQGRLSNPVTWRETRKLPFLDACVKEAGRLHPPFGLRYERVVPTEGPEICGTRVRGSTVVVSNLWVVHRDKTTFGGDAEAWRPDRWLCDEATRTRMEHGLLTVWWSNAVVLRQTLLRDSSARDIGPALERISRIWKYTSWFLHCCNHMT